MVREQAVGVLPSQNYLHKDGRSALVSVMRRCPEKFAHIKQNYKGGRTVEYWVEEAERLSEENGGILHSHAWLKRNEKSGLSHCIRKHPELFAHFEQEKTFKSLEDWVKIAEDICSKNGGVLPCHAWMKENKCIGLYNHKMEHPERFAHLKQNYKGGRSLVENVKFAESLAKANGGILPIRFELGKMGHSGLLSQMRSTPEAFAHIKQEKSYKSPEEHLLRAEQLVKENNGILPYSGFLKKNGDSDLYYFIRKNPNLFSHLSMAKVGRNLSENIELAESLAKANGGTLPPYRDIKKMGHSSLAETIRLKSEHFSHLPQEKMRKYLDQHIVDAEELAKENGGVLPPMAWFKKNRKIDLYASMRTYPEKFAHLKRSRMKKTVEDHRKKAIELENKHGYVPYHTWLRRNSLLDLSMCISHHPQEFKGIKQEYYCGRTKRIRTIS